MNDRYGLAAAARYFCSRLAMFTVYERPRDYPDKYVVRLFDTDKPTTAVWTFDTLEQVREAIPPGLACLRRDVFDDGPIVETWF